MMELNAQASLELDFQALEISPQGRNEDIDHYNDCKQCKKEIAILQTQIQYLKQQLTMNILQREQETMIFYQSMRYSTSKSTANAVLHTLFNQASAGKHAVLRSWWETGVIPTRDGLKHWKLDCREIRNEVGATLLHVAVDMSIARESIKVQLVEFLIDEVQFDVNIPDIFGRRPLHIAAMNGYVDVVHCLLSRGADITLKDQSGLTALSFIRTLSRPNEQIVQLLATAESTLKNSIMTEYLISTKKALVSAIFLKQLVPFVKSEFIKDYSTQTSLLVSVISEELHTMDINFNNVLQSTCPLLFTAVQGQYEHVTRCIFNEDIAENDDFLQALKVEAASYSISLAFVAPNALALLQTDKNDVYSHFLLNFIRTVKDIQAKIAEDSADTLSTSRMSTTSSLSSWSSKSSYTRQEWYYAVLFAPASYTFPGFLSTTKQSKIIQCSEDISRLFPFEDRLIIGSSEYYVVSYKLETKEIELDRPYEAETSTNVKAYLRGGSSNSLSPPYVAMKTIWEAMPGNPFEAVDGKEQELFQDYQFLDPTSEFEIVGKLGPIPTEREAKEIVKLWKTETREMFGKKSCLAKSPVCELYCPQEHGHAPCLESMVMIGNNLAKSKLGRQTLFKRLKPRASLQKLQDRFKGNAPWPGSPSIKG